MRLPSNAIRCLALGVMLLAIVSYACSQEQGQKRAANARLFAAIEAEDFAGVQSALADGASLSAHNKYGDTPMTAAAEQGNARLFSILAGSGANVNASDRSGQTPLIIAVAHDQIDVVRVLLQLKADVNATDTTGRSPIFYVGDNQEMLTLLLSTHPDLTLTDRDGRSALGEQAISNHREVAEQMVRAGAQYTSATDALYGAAAAGNIKIIDVLLAQGADPNGLQGVAVNMTPMMMAAFKGNTDAVRDLLAHGGDPEIADRNKQDTLFWACSSHNRNTVETVLKVEANLNGTPANFRRSALMTVVRVFDDPGMVRRLLDAGVSINAADTEGMTALMYAAQEDRRRDVAALLDAGADAALRDHMNRTAADFARKKQDESLAKALDKAAVAVPKRKR